MTRHNSVFGNNIEVGIGAHNSIFLGRNSRGSKLDRDNHVIDNFNNNITDSIALGDDAKIYYKDNATSTGNVNIATAKLEKRFVK